MEWQRRGSHGAHSPGLIVTRVRSWVLTVLHTCSFSLVGIVFVRGRPFSSVDGHLHLWQLSWGVVAVNRGLCRRPWGILMLNIRGWVVIVRGHSIFMVGGCGRQWGGRPWALDVWGELWSSMGGSSVWCLVYGRLWSSVGVVFICIEAVGVVVVCVWMLIVICRRSWWCMGVLIIQVWTVVVCGSLC